MSLDTTALRKRWKDSLPPTDTPTIAYRTRHREAEQTILALCAEVDRLREENTTLRKALAADLEDFSLIGRAMAMEDAADIATISAVAGSRVRAALTREGTNG